MALRFKLDTTVYDNPLGVNDITLTASLSDRHRIQGQEIGLDVTFTGAAAEYIKTQYSSSACDTIDVEVEEEYYNGTWTSLLTGFIVVADVVFQDMCARCFVQANIEDDSLSNQVERNIDSEVEMLSPVSCRAFEVQTGTPYPTADEFNLYKIKTALTNIVSAYTGAQSGLTSTFLSNTFREHIIDVTIPTVALNDVFLLEIETNIGGSYEVTVTADGSATPADVAEYMAKAVCLRNSVGLPGLEEMIFRVNAAQFTSGSSVVRVTSYAEITSISLKKNGVAVGGATSVFQAYRYGMGDLHISEQGLEPTKNLITWQKLYPALANLFDLQLQYTSGSVTVERHEGVYDGASASITGIQGNGYNLRPDKTWLTQNLKLGSLRTITGYDNSQSSWVSPDIDVNITRSTAIALANNAFFNMEAFTGNGDVNLASDYYARPENGEITVTLELQVFNNTGGAISTPVNIGMVVGGVTVETINHTFVNIPAASSQTHTYVFTAPYCLPAVGGFIQWQFTGVTTASLTYGGTSNIDVDYEPSCFTNPSVKEDDWSFGLTPTEYTACQNAEIDLSVDDEFYCGLGYELNQKLQGLQDLENTWFLIMADSSTGDPIRFDRRLFYPTPNALGCCYDDDFVNFAYYNMPLSRPYVVENWRWGVPADIDRVEYLFEMAYNFNTSAFSETVTRTAAETKAKQQDFRQIYETEDFIKTSDVKTIISDLVAGMEICGTSDDARWLDIEHNITTKRTRLRVLSDTVH